MSYDRAVEQRAIFSLKKIMIDFTVNWIAVAAVASAVTAAVAVLSLSWKFFGSLLCSLFAKICSVFSRLIKSVKRKFWLRKFGRHAKNGEHFEAVHAAFKYDDYK